MGDERQIDCVQGRVSIMNVSLDVQRAGTILEGSSQEEDSQQKAAAIAQALKAKAMVDHKDKVRTHSNDPVKDMPV